MLTEEENEAIETLQYLCSDDCISKDIIKTIVNLIKKLQKENEEYKLLNANIEKANRIIEGKEEYIPKGRIRELLKKSEDAFDFIDRIVELLGGIEEPYFEEEEQ